MAADHPAALGTFPFSLFLLQEYRDAFLFNGLQVLDHAHPEIGGVTFVEVLEIPAWKGFALVAEPHLVVKEQLASFLQEGAFLGPGPAAFAVGHPYSTAFDIVLQSEVPAADGAVHPAGSDQFFVHLQYAILWRYPFAVFFTHTRMYLGGSIKKLSGEVGE